MRSWGGRSGGISSERESLVAAKQGNPKLQIPNPKRRPKSEIRNPTRCDGATARREEGRNPKSEIRNPWVEIRSKNGGVIRRKRHGLDRLAEHYRSCEREGSIPGRKSKRFDITASITHLRYSLYVWKGAMRFGSWSSRILGVKCAQRLRAIANVRG